MMVPDDVGMMAFLGDAGLKATVLERLQVYEAKGDVRLKMAMLQEQWQRRARSGIVFNPFPKTVQPADIAGLRIGGDVSTLYALGDIDQSRLYLVGDKADSRLYLVSYDSDRAYKDRLGVPPSIVSLLGAVSNGLPVERETSWLRQFWVAVPVGASLWSMPMRLVLWALTDPAYGILGLEASAQTHEDTAGMQAVRDFLEMYENWQKGGKAEPPAWSPFCTNAERSAKSDYWPADGGKRVYDLPASERCLLLAAANAARSADVEETVVLPLPAGTIKIQFSGDSLRAPGGTIYQAGLYASEQGTASSVWYEACASEMLRILAEWPVPDQISRQVNE